MEWSCDFSPLWLESNVKVSEIKGKDILKKELIVDKNDLPIIIVYKDKRYILLLTKNEKLILNKYED